MHLKLLAFFVAGASSLVFASACGAVTVTTGPAEDIASEAATLTGVVSGAAPGSTFYFEFWWDEVPQHVEQSTAEAVPSAAEVRVMQKVYGFSASPTAGLFYTYRLVVNEPGEIVSGQPVSFETTPAGGMVRPASPKCRVASVIGRRLQVAERLLRKPAHCRYLRILVGSRLGGALSKRNARVESQSVRPGTLIESSGTVALRVMRDGKEPPSQ